MEESSSRQSKVWKFEDFVDRRLKPDLVKAIAQRDKVFQQQKVFQDLKRNIQNLEKNGATSLRTMVNLSSEVYMQADVFGSDALEFGEAVMKIKVEFYTSKFKHHHYEVASTSKHMYQVSVLFELA